MVSTGEARELLGVQAGGKFKLELTVRIELLRGFGLLVTIVMLLIGIFLTENFVQVNPGDTEFLEESTYIFKLFGFSHTCVNIDFNPAKSVAAMLVIFATVPLMIFTILNKSRIKYDHQTGKVSKAIYHFSECTWLFRIFAFAYFFMVFVNSPDGEFREDFDTLKERITDNGWLKYLLHYLPFFLWQLALALMSIEQTWYHYCLNDLSFGVSKSILGIYSITTALVLLYYTVWIFSHMFDYNLPGKDNVLFGKIIMYSYLGLTTVIPGVLALFRAYGLCTLEKEKPYVIAFYEKENTADEEN